jgi:hypothetical protein
MKQSWALFFFSAVLLFIFALNTSARAAVINWDFGDAPDPDYPTFYASDGARHQVVWGYHLGVSIDGEADGQPNDGNDEDGVHFPFPLVAGQVATVEIDASDNGYLDAWIDFNGDADWLDAGENIFSGMPLSAGLNTGLFFSIPATAVEVTHGRFRFGSDGGLLPIGEAPNGEVEDYRITIHSTPIPPAVYLLSSGLLGIVGLQRKMGRYSQR